MATTKTKPAPIDPNSILGRLLSAAHSGRGITLLGDDAAILVDAFELLERAAPKAGAKLGEDIAHVLHVAKAGA